MTKQHELHEQIFALQDCVDEIRDAVNQGDYMQAHTHLCVMRRDLDDATRSVSQIAQLKAACEVRV